MNSTLRTGWQRLRAGKPGRRFQDRYRASQRSDRRGLVGRIVRFVTAGAAIVIGIVLVFIPGPAILFFAIAGTLLATESLAVARFLDWSEVTIRAVATRVGRTWCASSPRAKIAAVTTAIVLGGAVAYGIYRLVFA